MKLSSFFFLALIILPSCRELVTDVFPEFTSIPTVNSILVKDSTIKVQVSLAGKLDTSRLALIDNADVSLYVDGVFKETMTLLDKGLYSSSVVVEPLKSYKCEVYIPGYELASGSDSIPVPAALSDIIVCFMVN